MSTTTRATDVSTSGIGTGTPVTTRIRSVDLIRGGVMILMAIDHVRVYSGLPAGGPTPGIFFTRWITNFCAPAFVFLAGTSAYLWARRHEGLGPFLLLRGAWLIVLELTFLRIAWTFNVDFAGYEMAGILWAIGWCMILLAGLSRLPLRTVAAIGLLVIGAHDLMDPFMATWSSLGTGWLAALWKIVYVGFHAAPIRFGPNGPTLMVLYSIIPWVGVMAVGYAFGAVLTADRPRRDRACLSIGVGATVLFIVLRASNVYGDPHSWTATTGGTGMAPLLAFLNTSKYPASLLFLLMTLGPVIALIPALERVHGSAADRVGVFGRVPFFYYVLHIPYIHALAIAVCLIRLGRVSPWLFANHPMGNPPAPSGYTWSLPLLYAVFAFAIVTLYFPCRWFAELKRRSDSRWLRFL